MHKKKSKDFKLTDTELEYMNILWKLGEGSVNDVLQNLDPHKKLAYTSVATILRVLEQKKILKSRKEGRGHIFAPLFSKADYEVATLGLVTKAVFENTPSALVLRLIDQEGISKEDLKRIKNFIEERLEEWISSISFIASFRFC